MLRLAGLPISLIFTYFFVLIGELGAQGLFISKTEFGQSPTGAAVKLLAVVILTIAYFAVVSRFRLAGRIFLLINAALVVVIVGGFVPRTFLQQSGILISQDDVLTLLLCSIVIAVLIALYRYGKTLPQRGESRLESLTQTHSAPVVKTSNKTKSETVKPKKPAALIKDTTRSPFDRGYD